MTRSAGGCGQQQVLQVAGKHPDRLPLGLFAQAAHQLGFQVQRNLDAPGPAHDIAQPFVGRPVLVDDAGMAGNQVLAGIGG